MAAAPSRFAPSSVQLWGTRPPAATSSNSHYVYEAGSDPESRRTLPPGTAQRAGYEGIGNVRNAYTDKRPAPGSGGLGARGTQELSNEEIQKLRDQLPSLVAHARTDKNAKKQLHLLERNTKRVSSFDSNTILRQQEIREAAKPETTKLEAASEVNKKAVTRQQAQEELPHLDLRGVYARMVNPAKLNFKIDYFNDAPFLADIQLYQLPQQIQETKDMFNWLESHFRTHLSTYLSNSICMSWRLNPTFLLKRYKDALRPSLIKAMAEVTSIKHRRGQAPYDTYLQYLEIVAQKVPLPIMNTPVIDIVDAGVLPLEYLRLFVDRRCLMENKYTEWTRYLQDHDPYLLQFGGPVIDQDDIADEMEVMHERYRRNHMEEQDALYQLARKRGTTQRYVNESSNGRISWNQRLPRKGMSRAHPGYPSNFAARDAEAETFQDLNDIYKIMRR
jgi:hypothetical protein